MHSYRRGAISNHSEGSVDGLAVEQGLQARHQVLLHCARALDRAGDHLAVVAAVGVGQGEHGNVLVDVASGLERGGVLVLIELEEAQAVEGAVELAVLDGLVKALAGFTPACADVHQHAQVCGFGELDLFLDPGFDGAALVAG